MSTVCNFFLLPVTSQFARVFVGILGRAQEKYPVRIHAAVATSSHYHLIVTPDDAEQLADFMEHFNGNLAREVGRVVEWRGRFWRERYHLIPISPEPEILESRLRYLLSNTIKEDLVARVTEWEGLHCGPALMAGKPLSGMWYHRALEYEAKRQAERRAARHGTAVEAIERGAFMTPYEVKLAPLPCWQKLSPAAIRTKVAEMIAEIETEAAERRERLGIEPRGMEKLRNQNPLSRPAGDKRSPRPLCHAATKEMRERVVKVYRSFVEMFREASLQVKFGNVIGARFPNGSFPPSLPFNRTGEVFDPLADAGGSPAFAELLAAAVS